MERSIVRNPAFSTIFFCCILSACTPQEPVQATQEQAGLTQEQVEQAQEPSLLQDQLCEVKFWQQELTSVFCKPGQKIVYLPNTFGNEQLPVIFAAVNCDMRYSIALTRGGVACIYAPSKIPDPADEPSPEESSSEEANPEGTAAEEP